MNEEKLVRATFVLDRETGERLNYVARRMGRSRSDLVREMLKEPAEMMERWVRTVPEDRPTTWEDAQRVSGAIQQDLVEYMDRRSAELGDAA